MNHGVLLELGLFPLHILAKKRAIKNWGRMATNSKCSTVLQNSYKFSIYHSLQWTDSMKCMLSEIGLMESFTNNDSDAHLKAFQRFQDIYHQTTLEGIKSVESRLRTYALFKTSPGFEKYLDEISGIKNRTALTKFRISNHRLMIEKGRHSKPKVPKELRFCHFCPNSVEDEKHFLLVCPTYKYIRSDLYSEAKKVFSKITNQPRDYRFLQLMSDVTAPSVSQFISRAMELREFLLSKNKMHG